MYYPEEYFASIDIIYKYLRPVFPKYKYIMKTSNIFYKIMLYDIQVTCNFSQTEKKIKEGFCFQK